MSSGAPDSGARRRTVHHDEALAWLAAHPAEPHTSVITSLPDSSELPAQAFDEWRNWFQSAVRAVLSFVPPGGAAIFFQTDVLRRGVWVDKSYLVLSAAESSDRSLIWHKVVCRAAPGTATPGRAGYSHLLAFGNSLPPSFKAPLPDVLAETGFMPTRKATGVEACALACRFLLAETATRIVVDPFCGQGTVLAVANAFGLDAVGIDHSQRCCRAARKLTFCIEGSRP